MDFPFLEANPKIEVWTDWCKKTLPRSFSTEEKLDLNI